MRTRSNLRSKVRGHSHSRGELVDGVVEAAVHPVDDVDSVGLRVGDLLLHEAAEAGEVRGDGGDAHDGALGRGVAPRLVVAGEHAHVAACEGGRGQFPGLTKKTIFMYLERILGNRGRIGGWSS